MSQLSVTIDGKSYRMACNPDEEAHLLSLAEDLDRRISGLKQDFGEIGDTRSVIMVALMLSDELSHAKARIAALEARVDGLSQTHNADVERAIANEGELAALIDRTAQRIESLAVALGNRPMSNGNAANHD